MEWMLLPLHRYAEFSGRSQRKEYWIFHLGYWLALAACYLLSDASEALGGLLALVVFFGGFIPAIAVTVRRLHDQDKSAWWLLLYLLPSIGSLILLILMCIDGTPGGNRYGDDPKGRDLRDVFS